MIEYMDPRYDRLHDLGYNDEQMARLSSRSADQILVGGVPPPHWDRWEDDDRLIESPAPHRAAPQANGHAPETSVNPEVVEPPVEILPPPPQPAQVPHDGFNAQIRAAMLDYGIACPPATFVPDGRWHRFDPDGGRGDAGSYILRDHGYVTVCTYIDHRCADDHQTVKIKSGHNLSPQEMREYRRQAKEQQARADAELKAEQDRVAAEAQARWGAAREVTSTEKHAYLARKKVQPHGLRIDGRMLLVPVRGVDGKLWTLQTIPPDGDKRFILGGRALGGMHMIGDVGSGDTFCLSEGYATASTIFEATGYPVICCFSADNLVHVAPLWRQKYPSARVIIAGDDDWMTREGKPRIAKENKGRIRATEAAKAIGGILAFPWFDTARAHKATDFNDQAALYGANSVKFSIEEAIRCFEDEAERQPKAEKTAGGDGCGTAPPDGDAVDADIWSQTFDTEEQAWEAAHDIHAAIIKDMNAVYAAMQLRGKFRVMTEFPDGAHPLQRDVVFSTKSDFTAHVTHPMVPVPYYDRGARAWKVKGQQRGAWWLTQKSRRRFHDIDFVPGSPRTIGIQDPDVPERTISKWNMWSGFTVRPVAEDCSLYLAHLKNNICGGDDVVYKYTLDWMASGVQRPEEPGRAAISLRGEPGVGKGVFVQQYGMLYGRHFIHLQQREHLVGKFNAHSAEACLIFADEAIFVGDKRDDQPIKILISEKGKILERKGIDSVSVRNFARLIFATNHDHPLRIAANDRRFLALHVALPPNLAGIEKRTARKAYFDAIIRQMDKGGRAALLHMLMKRDISGFDPEDIPQTEELQQQKLLSAPAGDQFIISLAQAGCLPGARERPWIARAHVEDQYGLLDRMRREGGPDLGRKSDQELADILKAWEFTSKRYNDGKAWVAPDLCQLRNAVSKKYPAVGFNDEDQPDEQRQKWGHANDE
jgi:phage/plasmid primase-like uncharacterized protein